MRARGASPGTATAAAEGREGAKYRAQTKPSHTHTIPPKPYPPKAAFPEGTLRPVRPLTPKRMPTGILLTQLQWRVVKEGGDCDQAGRGASHGGARLGVEGDPGRVVRGGGGQAPGERKGARSSARGTDTREGPGRSPQRERAEAPAGRQCRQQRGRTGTRDRQGHGQQQEGRRAW